MRLRKKIGFVIDPLATLDPKKDSTLSMIAAAHARECNVFLMEIDDLLLNHNIPYGYALNDTSINATNITKTSNLVANQKDQPNSGSTLMPLSELDIILMRKDPPVDERYLFASYLLDFAQNNGVMVSNQPSSLRNFNEKLFALHFESCCAPTLVTHKMHEIESFIAEHHTIVLKPLNGMGGKGIIKIQVGDKNLTSLVELLTKDYQHPILVQRFIPDIQQGDKRILLINGEPIPFAVARIPKANENRGNLAAGGLAKVQALSAQDHWICEQIGPTLRSEGLHFVGIDVIGDYLTEINVTSPTGVREISEAKSIDIAGNLMDFLISSLHTVH